MSDRPNIRLVTTDQQRAYTPSPLCTPPRVSLLTGQYPSVHGATSIGVSVDPFSEDLITYRLSAAGYRTALLGIRKHPGVATYDYGFDGWLDDVAIFEGAFTEAMARALYTVGSHGGSATIPRRLRRSSTFCVRASPTRSAGAHGPGSTTTPWPATRATSSTSTATLRFTPWCWTPRATAFAGSEEVGVCDTDAIRIDSGHGSSQSG